MEPTGLIQKQINDAKGRIGSLTNEVVQLEALKKKITDKKGMDKWIDFEFESSSGLTEEFAQFSRDFKKHLKNVAKPDYEVVSFSRGHFECTAFFRNIATGKFVYVSISDIRFFSNEWYNNILVRTAKHEKDYTGGSNCSCTLPELKDSLIKLSN